MIESSKQPLQSRRLPFDSLRNTGSVVVANLKGPEKPPQFFYVPGDADLFPAVVGQGKHWAGLRLLLQGGVATGCIVNRLKSSSLSSFFLLLARRRREGLGST